MKKEIILEEVSYAAVRSSGAGGQHVNKVSSKIVLSFDIAASQGLSDREKELLKERLATRLTKEGVLQISCSESRSQFRNKALANERLFDLLTENLIPPTVRKRTKPTWGSVKRKAQNKKRHSEKKNLRKKPGMD